MEPTLFLISINDHPEVINSQQGIYADDTFVPVLVARSTDLVK